MKSIKLFTIMIFFVILLVGTVSAFEFDNIKNYDEETKTVDIRNSILGIPFLQLSTVATIRLETPGDMIINNINQPIAEFEINNTNKYVNFLNKIETFKKVDGGDILNLNYNYKYFNNETGTHLEESTRTKTYDNETLYEENYMKEVIGSWLPFDETLDLPGGNLKMRMFFSDNIPSNQIIEIIPTFFGVRINEWFTVELKQNYDCSASPCQSQLFDDDRRLAQVFTPQSGQTIQTLGINISKSGNIGTLFGGIYNTTDGTSSGAPDDSALVATFTNLSDASVPSNWDFINLTFSDNNATLCDNCSYAIIIDATTQGGGNTLRWGSDATGSEYSFGNFWFDTLPHTSWTEVVGTDLFFRTWALVDSTDPIINVFSPTNTTFTTSTIFFNATANEAIDTFIVNYNGTNTSSFPINTSLQVENGFHHLLLYANDTSGNTGLNDTIFFTVAAPPIINITSPENITYNFTSPLLLNYTNNSIATQCWVSDNDGISNSSPVTCGTNGSSFNSLTKDVGINTWILWSNESTNIIGKDSVTFTLTNFIQGLFNFNSSTFETKDESFTVNITTNGTTPTSAILSYNATNNSGSITNTSGNNFNLSATIPVLTGTGNKTWNYFFQIGGVTTLTTTTQQNVSGTSFGLCNTTLISPHINFTFRNETLGQENVNGTISSTWVYSLSDLSGVTKSLIFSNATENANYTFCGTPDTIPFNINVNLTYNNDISQQRSFSLTTILTSTTTTQVLHLLPTALGIFSPFKTVTITGDPFTDVRAVITRILGGLPIDVTSGFTDGSGFITFFLNPDETYTATFSKVGVADNIFSFFPTTDLRTVIMGQQVSAITNGTTIARGLLYNITPVNGTLANNTNVNFTLFASSNETITLMSLNITNSTNTQLLFVNATSQGLISGILNTGNQTKLIGTYIIQTATETITVKKIYIIGIQFEGDYSIYRQFTLFTTYGFSDFIRILFVIFFISIILIFLTRREVIDTSESKVIVATLLVWAFSLVGWLDTGLVSSTSSTGINRLSQFSNQFGIAIISTGISLFFILRRVFIRRP